MSRRKKKPTQRVAVPIEKLNAMVERTRTEPLPEDEHATLEAAVDTLARLTEALEAKTTTLQRVRHLIFGPRTETTDKVLSKDTADTTEPAATNPSAVGEAATALDGKAPRKPPRQGHGRNGAADPPGRTWHSSPQLPNPSTIATPQLGLRFPGIRNSQDPRHA